MRLTESEYKAELASYGEAFDVEHFYYAWRFLLILWRSIWFRSDVDWSRYRLTIWDRFTRWVISAARRSKDVAGFLAIFVREARLAAIGTTADEREWLVQFAALPCSQQRQVIRQLREDTCLLVALVKMFQSRNREKQGWKEMQDVELD